MRYDIKAIETKFKGYTFRSRLEARWAATFELLGWEWDYEPVDFNGWLPDFAIYGHDTVYVEVKPVLDFPEDVGEKIAKSGCIEEVMIVGQRFPFIDDDWGCCIGWLAEQGYEWGLCWEPARLRTWEDYSENSRLRPKFGFCHSIGMYHDRISGDYDGNCETASHLIYSDIESAKKIWAEAHRLTRYTRSK